MNKFDESKHPRDEKGRFSVKGKSKRKQALEALRKIKPLVICLPDEEFPKSVGAMWKNHEIIMPDGTIAKFAEGSKLQNKQIFAGYGTRTPIRDIERLNIQYGTSSKKWKKVKANALIINNGEEIDAEVHWYEEETIGKVELKFKKYL